jgi:hypothetical protein
MTSSGPAIASKVREARSSEPGSIQQQQAPSAHLHGRQALFSVSLLYPDVNIVHTSCSLFLVRSVRESVCSSGSTVSNTKQAVPGAPKPLQQLHLLTKPAGDACLENIGHEKGS